MTYDFSKKILLILSILLLFTACSSKNSVLMNIKKNETTKITSNDTLDDEFDDEFEAANIEISDPLEGYNRWMTSVNDKFYLYMFDPVSKGYAVVVPKPARVGISNAFHNLNFPIRFANNLLQFKFDSSMKELGRFMINSSIGILGFFDVAKMGGIEPQEEDFGQTLGFYGVGTGPHLVLPFLGPSNLRDTLGFTVDSVVTLTNNASLTHHIADNTEKELALIGLYYVNKNSLHPGEYENLKKDALDVYTFFRDTYEQKRAKDIEK